MSTSNKLYCFTDFTKNEHAYFTNREALENFFAEFKHRFFEENKTLPIANEDYQDYCIEEWEEFLLNPSFDEWSKRKMEYDIVTTY